jgi:TIR domain
MRAENPGGDCGADSVFISHSSLAIKRAVRFKELMLRGSSNVDVFLSSDWDSIRSGAIWVEEIEKALSCCKHFVALLTGVEDARSPWINYEIGYARGKGILPLIFLFDSIKPEDVPYPVRMLHLICPGDTNRRVGELQNMRVSDRDNEFGKLLYLRSDADVDTSR